MTVPSSTPSKTEIDVTTTANGTTYDTTFTVHDAEQLTVYKNSVLVSVDDYTVTIVSSVQHSNVARVIFDDGFISSTDDIILLIRNAPYSQNLDFINNSVFDIETLERGLDQLTMQPPQLETGSDATIRFSDTLTGVTAFSGTVAAAATITANKAARTNKGLKFDGDGNITLTLEDPDAAVAAAASSADSASNSAGTATTKAGESSDSAVEASGSAGTAEEWATKVTGAVADGEFSSKAHAIGGTGVDTVTGSANDWAPLATTPSDVAEDASAKEWAVGTSTHKADGSAKSWATITDAAVTGSLYSAKEYAQGDANSGALSTGGSAKAWAQDIPASSSDDVDGGTTNDRSAKAWAQGANMTGATLGGSSKDWAQKADGNVNGSEFSAKAYASVVGASAPTDGSAREWANTEGAVIADSEYSAKEYAIGTTVAAGSAKDWASQASGTVDGTLYSAKYHATAAATSAGEAATSASSAASAPIVMAIALG